MMTTSRAAAGLRPPRWRRWATAGIVAATSLSTALVTAPAGASGTPPQISVVTGSAGTKTVSLGHPQKATTAKLSPGHVAFNPANGDEAVSVRTSGGQARVYLIAGASGPNEYHIATSITSTTHTPLYGTLVKGDAYLMAGNGTVGIVGFPGGGTTTTSGESPHVGAVTNPVAPVSLAFDNSGNLLIGEALPLATATETGIQIVAKAACTSACPYKYTSLAAGGLYTIAASGQVTGATLTPAISFTYQVYGYGLAVDAQGNIIDGSNNLIVFLNEGTATLTRYGKSLAHHKATLIAGTTTGAATCGDGSVNVPATGASSPALQWPHPFVDPSGNVYFSDNQVSSGKGCTWVLPAESGSLDGMTVTAGRMYSLTGAATTTAETSGAVANKTSFPNAVAAVTDAAGNVVVALSGTTPAVRVIAESTATYYDQAMTAGHVYTISGGPAATRTTTPGNATGFKLPGAARPTKPPAFGLTSITPGAPGDLLLTDGSSATTASLYEITGGPTGATVGAPAVTSVTPVSGSTSGGIKVTIHGSNLASTTGVDFGTVPATTIVATSTTVTVTNPPHPAGTVAVSVTTLGGSATEHDAFTYIVPPPTLTSLAPTSGTVTGGTVVTIHGGNLSTTSTVEFGTVEATTLTAIGTSSVTVTTPAHTAGKVTVTLTTAGGKVTRKTAFTYVAATLPGPPTDVTAARAGSGAVAVAWHAAATHGSQITGYRVTATGTAKTCSTSGALTCTIMGLTNGETYGFRVIATSAAGTGPPSAPVHLIPATIPGAPGTPVAIPGVASATVFWVAPTPTPGNIGITKYTVTSTPTGKTCTAGGTTTHRCRVTTLMNGTSYTFKVKATNAVGTGPTTPASNVVIPETRPPTSPTMVKATAGNGSATVTWTPPATTGGSPVTGYSVTSTPTAKTCTTTGALTCTVTGLTNGNAYTFSVTATNAAGTSPTSQASTPVTPTATAATTGGAAGGGKPVPTQGYTEVAADGGIFNYGTANFYGSKGGQPLNAPVVGIAATPTGKGYWEVAADGGIFNYGTANFYGSKGGQPLNAPVVGIAATPTGKGYWEVAADGGIFSYGTANFYGSKGGQPLNAPVVGIAATPTGQGYWEVASDGGIFNYGTANFYGSKGGQPLNAPVVGIAATPTGQGYWEVAADGGIFNYGTANFYGSKGGQPLNAPVVDITPTPSGKGYWEVAADGGIFNYGTANFYGSKGGQPLNAPIVGITSTPLEVVH